MGNKLKEVHTCLLKVSAGLGLAMNSTSMSSILLFLAPFLEDAALEVDGAGGGALPGVDSWLRSASASSSLGSSCDGWS